jgi:hypothetical protein
MKSTHMLTGLTTGSSRALIEMTKKVTAGRLRGTARTLGFGRSREQEKVSDRCVKSTHVDSLYCPPHCSDAGRAEATQLTNFLPPTKLLCMLLWASVFKACCRLERH